MARLIFLRHAHSAANEAGILSGQLAGVALSNKGRAQSLALVERLGASNFDSIRVSPMQRCQETIAPWIASKYSQSISQYTLDDGLIEVDYGSWSGRKLSRLSREKLWKVIQTTPSKVIFPEGEKISAMQKRAIASVQQAVLEKRKGNHLFVSHGDVIKAIVASLLSIKLDNFQSLVIDPASITILDVQAKDRDNVDLKNASVRLLSFNDTSSDVSRLTKMEKSSTLLLGGGARKIGKGSR